jgi:hypothetical protein
VALFCATGGRLAFEHQDEKPSVFFAYGENDAKVNSANVDANVLLLKSRGVRTHVIRKTSAPLAADRFTRIDGISLEESIEIYTGFRDAGVIGGQGRIKRLTAKFKEQVPEALASHAQDIEDQMTAVYAGHMLFDEANDQMIEFFFAEQ